MKKYLIMAILIMLVGSSGAVSEKKLDSAIKVNIKDNSFLPSVLTVPVGATVGWHNQDGVQHSVTSDIQGLFDSGVLMPGMKFTFTFNAPGSFSYHCGIHPGMQGVITVTGTASLQDEASWSEEPLSSSNHMMSADLQSETEGATEGSILQPQFNPATDQIALQKFSQYYRTASEAPEDQLTTPTKIDLDEAEPAMLYFGSTQKAVPYAQYQSYALSTGTNSLWISGSSSWTQYAMVPLGSTLSMIIMSSAGGYGYLYEIYPDGNLDKNSYYFNPYNQIGFYADKVGQHQLFFNIAGQPSNVIVIDVAPRQTPAQPVNDLAAVTIRSSWLRGYNVYVDGSYQATEAMTGESDGTVTINVPGNQYHNIAIDGSGLTFSDYKYFKAGYAYQLNV